MTQKELLYIEDIYNHENTIVLIIEDALKKLKDKSYNEILESHIKTHNLLIKKIEKLLSGESNE